MIIAGTGHRPPVLFKDNFYSEENKRKLIEFCKEQINNNIPIDESPIKIISGMAQGWDNAIAHAALELGFPLLAAVPFEGMDAKWPEESKKDFHYILSKANEVKIICEGGYANWKFYQRDKFMVDNATEILALYNGYPTGGTAITVRYALEVNKPIINCWDSWTVNECISSV